MDYSLEVLPEATPEGMDRLLRIVESYARAFPIRWASVISKHGVGMEATLSTARAIQTSFGLDVSPHLTGRGKSRDDLSRILESLEQAGLTSIIAVRGDGPPMPQDPFPTGADLVQALLEMNPDLQVSVGCYPEGHPESPDENADLAALHAKLNAGASRLITQFTLHPGSLKAFLARIRHDGITAPVVAGIASPANPDLVNALATRFGIKQHRGYGQAVWDALRQEALEAGYADVHLFSFNQPFTQTKGGLHASL